MKHGWPLLLLAAFSVTGCVRRAAPNLSSLDAHPLGYWEMIQLEPQCKHPTAEERDACNAGAAMLEQNASKATETFLLLWWDTLRALPNRGAPRAPSGDFAAAFAVARKLRAEIPTARARTREDIALLAFTASLERSSSRLVASEMREHLHEVDFRSRASWNHFADAYARALREPASTKTPGAPDAFAGKCVGRAAHAFGKSLENAEPSKDPQSPSEALPEDW